MPQVKLYSVTEDMMHYPLTTCETYAEALFRAEGLIDFTPTHLTIRCYIDNSVIMEMARGVFQPSLFHWEELQSWEQ